MQDSVSRDGGAPYAGRTVEGGPGRAPRPAVGRASRRAFVTVFALPLALWQGIFFLAPVLFMAVMTFWSVRNYQLSADFT